MLPSPSRGFRPFTAVAEIELLPQAILKTVEKDAELKCSGRADDRNKRIRKA